MSYFSDMFSDYPTGGASLLTCHNCGKVVHGKFCSQCGNTSQIKRLTLRGLINEVFHYFTHLDQGFPFTLKKLIQAPGTMQRQYVDGTRQSYQKPFSMLFICASVTALALYLINAAVIKYLGGGNNEEVMFFNRYWVLSKR
jgi:hypothetical protein